MIIPSWKLHISLNDTRLNYPTSTSAKWLAGQRRRRVGIEDVSPRLKFWILSDLFNSS